MRDIEWGYIAPARYRPPLSGLKGQAGPPGRQRPGRLVEEPQQRWPLGIRPMRGRRRRSAQRQVAVGRPLEMQPLLLPLREMKGRPRRSPSAAGNKQPPPHGKNDPPLWVPLGCSLLSLVQLGGLG